MHRHESSRNSKGGQNEGTYCCITVERGGKKGHCVGLVYPSCGSAGVAPRISSHRRTRVRPAHHAHAHVASICRPLLPTVYEVMVPMTEDVVFCIAK